MSIESQLRVALHDAADDVTTSTPPDAARAVGMRDRQRRHSRRRNSALAVGLATVLVAVAVQVGLASLSRAPEVAAPSVPPADIFGVPTRGSLAGDEELLEAIAALPWTAPAGSGDLPMPDPPVAERRVVFAGDLPYVGDEPGGRWALVVGPNTIQPTGPEAEPSRQTDLGAISDLAGVWYVGPHGASPEEMAVVTIPRGIVADKPASLYDSVTGRLVVVAAPGDLIETSLRPEVSAQAEVSRTWVDLDALDGPLVAAVGGDPYQSGPPSVQYRVSRAGVVLDERSPDGFGPSPGPGPEPVGLTYLRPPVTVPGVPPGQEQMMAGDIFGEYGLPAAEMQIRVHYVRPVPGPSGSAAGLTVLTSTFPSGAVLTRAFWLQEIGVGSGAFGGSQCADSLAPAGVPVQDRVLALRCDVAASSGGLADAESTLVALAPPDTTAVVATALGGSDPVDVELVAGVGMIPFPDGAQQVRILDAAGNALATTSILTV